ncbi:MAG TPA: hypothetical protein VHB77_17680 [Planctomycetaceae bacterium]|nr:hypothetical protein [Planctomycetaceae bacterium]
MLQGAMAHGSLKMRVDLSERMGFCMPRAIVCLLFASMALVGCGAPVTNLRDTMTKTSIEISHPGASAVQTSSEEMKSLQGEVIGHKYTVKWTKDEKPVTRTIEFERKVVRVDGKEIGPVGDGSVVKIDETGGAKIEQAK